VSQKLTDFSPAKLVRANRANLYSFFRHFEHSPYMEFNKSNGFTRWCGRLQIDWYNGILCERDATKSDGAFIDDSLAYFKAKNTTEMTVWLEEGVHLAGWEALLARRGFKLVEGPPGMSVDLHRLNETINLPTGAEIKIIRDEKSMQDRTEVLINGYGGPPSWKDSMTDFYLGLGFDFPFRSYLAYWNGKPVSTAEVFFGEEVAGINGVTTLPEARGKGFAAAVTLAALIDARKMGYRVGTLQATKMGFPIYLRMGFEQNFNLGFFNYTFK
jgi:GNAT superfamily N-acetyltransferase